MSTLLVAAMLSGATFGAVEGSQSAAPAGLPSAADGTWRVVSAEVSGTAAGTTGAAGVGGVVPGTLVSIRNGVLTFGTTQPAGVSPTPPGRREPEPSTAAPASAPETSSARPIERVPVVASTGSFPSWQLRFGPNNQLWAVPVRTRSADNQTAGSGATGRTSAYSGNASPSGSDAGVFIQTHDYLCVSFHSATAWPQATPVEHKGGAGAPLPSAPAVPGAAEGMRPGSAVASPSTGAVGVPPAPATGQAGSSVVLILHREGTGTGPSQRGRPRH